MFSKFISFLMSILMFICSLFGIDLGQKSDSRAEISYNSDKTAVSISVDENATTGYSWTYVISDESKLSLAGSDFSQSVSDTEIVGAGGTRTFSFKALDMGDAVVTLIYQRDWEAEPIRIVNVSVKILSNLTMEAEVISDTYAK